jgi:hypothetical protein
VARNPVALSVFLKYSLPELQPLLNCKPYFVVLFFSHGVDPLVTVTQTGACPGVRSLKQSITDNRGRPASAGRPFSKDKPNTKGDTMMDVIRKVSYFAMDVADKPGEAARVLTVLSQAGVNLLAFSGFPRGRRSQLDFIPEDAELFRKALSVARLKVQAKKTGFLVQGDDRPGAVAEVLRKLADANINVTAVDGVSAGGGRWGAILWVKPQSVNKAARVLQAV